MNQLYEFRILEKFVSRIFSSNEGRKLPGDFIRLVTLRGDDPRMARVAAAQRELLSVGETFFLGWAIHRRYTRKELASADVLHFRVTKTFEPAGEQCETTYDNSTACPECGSGATRTSPLILDVSHIPRSDVARSIAGEMVMSKRLTELLRREAITGMHFRPIYCCGTVPLLAANSWREPVIICGQVEIVAPTRGGADPFADIEKEACARGDLLGPGLLSEVFIKAASRGTEDIVATQQMIGVRRGVLRPEPIMIVSQKLAQVLIREKIQGVKLEVAHLVTPTT